MNSKNITAATSAHLARVKELSCSVCSLPGPSDAHHIKQGQHYTAVALCKECHQHPMLGWHGQRRMWNTYKMDELAALDVTLSRLFTGKP